MAMKVSYENAVKELSFLFRRNGYVLEQNALRYQLEGHQRYKKGDEVRLTASSISELTHIEELLIQVGFSFGRSFAKGKQFRLPIYGREEVRRFMQMIEDNASTKGTGSIVKVTRLATPSSSGRKAKGVKHKQESSEELPTKRCRRFEALANSPPVFGHKGLIPR